MSLRTLTLRPACPGLQLIRSMKASRSVPSPPPNDKRRNRNPVISFDCRLKTAQCACVYNSAQHNSITWVFVLLFIGKLTIARLIETPTVTWNVCIVIMIFFLSAATRKHAAAREVFQKIPPDSIDVIHKQWEITVGLCQIAAYCY